MKESMSLSVCEDDEPPEYRDHKGTTSPKFLGGNGVVTSLCTLTVDLSPLRPFQRLQGKKGWYYQVNYEIGLAFGNELVFALVHNGKLVGSVNAKYYTSSS